MKLFELKGRKKAIEAILRSNMAMKSFAISQIHKSKTFLENSLDLDEKVYKKYFDQFIFKEKNVLNLLIAHDKGMCSEFSSEVNKYFQKNKKNEMWGIFGSKFEQNANNTNVFYFQKVDPNVNNSAKVAYEIINFLIKYEISKVVFHYFDKNSMVKFVLFDNIKCQENYSVEDKFELSNFAVLYLANFLIQFFNSSLLIENKKRVIAVEQAKNNAQKMEKNIKIMLNRSRQTKITSQLNEIVAGIL